MNKADYDKWCDATRNVNSALQELNSQRQENYRWFCDELKELFSVCGTVETVQITRDGSIIDIEFSDDGFTFKEEVFEKIYCPMKVYFDGDNDYSLKIRLFLDVKLED